MPYGDTFYGKTFLAVRTKMASCFFSAAMGWEIAIKHRLARSDMPVSGKEASGLFLEAGPVELLVTAAHADATEELPLHHADPFDRILVAQAHYKPLRLLTNDQQLLACVGFLAPLLEPHHSQVMADGFVCHRRDVWLCQGLCRRG